MAAKQLQFSEEARRLLLRGVDSLTNTVRVTLGPRARTVVLEKKWGSPTICDDGVMIAKEIELPDKYENLGAQMVKEVASKTSDVAGDGTTTATILAHAIFKEGLKNVTSGANPIAIKRGIDKVVEVVVKELERLSKKIDTKKEMAQVATISAHGDTTIGDLIADAMEKVGKDGVVTVEEGKAAQTTLEFVEGMQFDRGYVSAYFVTNAETMKVELEDPYILIHEKKISNMKDFIPLLQKVVNEAKPLLVIAEELEGEALATLVVNKLRGLFSCAAVKAPGYGDRRKAMLGDIAILTDGKLLSEDLGIKLENVGLRDLGRAKKVIIDKENTTIVEGAGSKEAINGRIAQIKREIEDTKSDYDREKLQERLAKLAGGVAVINVGAATETEMKTKKATVEDALHATRAAVEEGIVPGGGVAYIRSISALEKLKLEGDEQIGVNIVKHAMEAPLRQLAYNSGRDASIVVERVKSEKGNVGFDALNEKFVDMVSNGIIDPTKVTRCALQNAASVAGLMLTTEALITDVPEKKEEKAGAAPGGMPHHDEF